MSNSLLPINATKLLRDLEQSNSNAFGLEVRNRYILSPNKLGIDILPWLAWSLSIDIWNDKWSAETKRQMVTNSISIHRIKGTKKAIRQALEIVGVFAEITEWWEVSKKMPPHTFSVTAYLNDNLNKDEDVI
ncbi:MAG: phage tail protein I, partial [Proteobacteria bacterium]|nr:phage tail protein I [Pseudomonadota bacterium]